MVTGFLSWSRAWLSAASARVSSDCKRGSSRVSAVIVGSSIERIVAPLNRFRVATSSGAPCSTALRRDSTPRIVPVSRSAPTATAIRAPRSWLRSAGIPGFPVMSTWKLRSVFAIGSWEG